ncbi:MAG: DUF4260 domain-containing protein [Chelatococcus sp.]|nr:MAG: DUF4260 domain-containing protein [Chelatococcus sp.]
MSEATAGPVGGAPKLLLHLEGLLLAAICIWLFARSGASWWLFGALILVPDLSMLGYVAGPRPGAILYNAAHTLLGPGLLGAAGLALAQPTALAVAMIWGAHIGIDRVLGYGLKYPSRFADTHLGVLGPARKAG